MTRSKSLISWSKLVKSLRRSWLIYLRLIWTLRYLVLLPTWRLSVMLRWLSSSSLSSQSMTMTSLSLPGKWMSRSLMTLKGWNFLLQRSVKVKKMPWSQIWATSALLRLSKCPWHLLQWLTSNMKLKKNLCRDNASSKKLSFNYHYNCSAKRKLKLSRFNWIADTKTSSKLTQSTPAARTLTPWTTFQSS